MERTADDIRSNMHARRIDMGDGRYLIFYTFDGELGAIEADHVAAQDTESSD